MADIKTHLRELSVAVGAGTIIRGEALIDYIPETKEFLEKCELMIDGDISSANNISDIDIRKGDYPAIIKNGYKLARLIDQKLPIRKEKTIIWVGNDTQKSDPVDLKIGQFEFSLKENSFILENMGLYKYLTLMTGKRYDRGLHVFKAFAANEYEEWFRYTFSKVLEVSDWKYEKEGGKYFSTIKHNERQIIFNYNNEEISTIPITINSTDQFNRLTSTKTREKVFSKWIKDNLEKKDSRYTELKKKCSETAGKNICNLVNNNMNKQNIARLLQVRNNSYYYAKSTVNETTILFVPGIKEYNDEFEIDPITYKVPDSQLNIITTIKNKKTNKVIVMRNECRFSHGQFNGTPEAKMYYDHGSNLEVIYRRL